MGSSSTGSSLSNQLLVNVGSLMAANGAILLVSPGRFARLRTSRWTPATFDTAVASLTGDVTRGRVIGAAVLAVGVTMIVVGMSRTQVSR